jgi:hypothetical protein
MTELDRDRANERRDGAEAPITRNERAELRQIVRLNCKVARATVDQRQADLLADLEEQMAAEWKEHDAFWREACSVSNSEIQELNQRLQDRFAELGVPPAEAPSLAVSRGSSGNRGDRGRREDLRRAARARTAADAQKAKLALDAAEARLLTKLASQALTSDAARAFLDEIPKVGQLMPVLNLSQLELMEGASDHRLPFDGDAAPF